MVPMKAIRLILKVEIRRLSRAIGLNCSGHLMDSGRRPRRSRWATSSASWSGTTSMRIFNLTRVKIPLASDSLSQGTPALAGRRDKNQAGARRSKSCVLSNNRSICLIHSKPSRTRSCQPSQGAEMETTLHWEGKAQAFMGKSQEV